MSTILIFLLTICELNVLKCTAVDSSVISSNQIDEISDLEAEIPVTNVILEDDVYPDPLFFNALVFQFHRNPKNVERDEFEARRRSALDKNFMRFGRTGLLRFGKRQAETTGNLATDNNNDPNIRLGRSESTGRESRGDSFMRFGRGDSLMRFGRTGRLKEGDSLMRFGRGDSLMRFGRTGRLKEGDSLMRFERADNMMRFGRADNMMRFGRADNMMRFGRADNMMRFGRADNMMRFGRQPAQNPMRFGRSSDNGLMRFGRGDSFMRFGRNPSFAKTSETFPKTANELLNDDIYLKVSAKSEPNLMRFGRSDNNFMRFGKLDQNFMRFGKRNKELVVPSSMNSTNTSNTPADNPGISKLVQKQVLDYLFSEQSKNDSQETEDDELVESTLSSNGIDNRFSKSGVRLPANDELTAQ